MSNIFFQYLEWHFIDMPKVIFGAWKNFLKFNLAYFSISLLLKTFFSPWHHYRYSYGKGFDPKKYVEVFFSNIISRFIGAVMRTILIIVGIVLEVLIFFGGIIILVGWLIFPILLIICLILIFNKQISIKQ